MIKEDFVRLTEFELEFLMSAMQHLSTRTEAALQQQHHIDSRELYAKLSESWDRICNINIDTDRFDPSFWLTI